MKNLINVRYLIPFVLILCVLSTNHIIIYNEELLVALAFFLFIKFVADYSGTNVKESLDSTSSVIKEIFESITRSKKQNLETLLVSLQNSVKSSKLLGILKSGIKNKCLHTPLGKNATNGYFYQKLGTSTTYLTQIQDNMGLALVHSQAISQEKRLITNYIKNKRNSQGKSSISSGLDKALKVIQQSK